MFCLNFTFRQLAEMLLQPLLRFKMLTMDQSGCSKKSSTIPVTTRIWSPVNSFTCLNGWPTYNWGRFGASMIHHQPQVPNQNFPKKTGAKVPNFTNLPQHTTNSQNDRCIVLAGRLQLESNDGIMLRFAGPGEVLTPGPGRTWRAIRGSSGGFHGWYGYVWMLKGCQVPLFCFFWEWWTWSCCEFWSNFWIDGNWLGMFSRS